MHLNLNSKVHTSNKHRRRANSCIWKAPFPWSMPSKLHTDIESHAPCLSHTSRSSPKWQRVSNFWYRGTLISQLLFFAGDLNSECEDDGRTAGERQTKGQLKSHHGPESHITLGTTQQQRSYHVRRVTSQSLDPNSTPRMIHNAL